MFLSFIISNDKVDMTLCTKHGFLLYYYMLNGIFSATLTIYI